MTICDHCGVIISGSEVHCVDDNAFCSRECAIAYLTDEIITNAKESAIELYDEAVTILEPKGQHANCAVCDKDLATVETIYAVNGRMYCSRDCGLVGELAKYASTLGVTFDAMAEEITPAEIGLEVQE